MEISVGSRFWLVVYINCGPEPRSARIPSVPTPVRVAALLLLPLLPAGLSGQPALRRRIAAIAAQAHGKVAVACSLPGTRLDCDLNPRAHPPMQSVFKAPLAFTALHLVETGKLGLDDPIRFRASDRILPHAYSPLQDQYPQAEVSIPLRRLLQLAVSLSDNVAADLVLRALGGTGVVNRYLEACGVRGFHLRDGEAALHRDTALQYRNWFEPAGAVQFLRLLSDRSPLTPEHTALLLEWMRDGAPGSARIKGLLPAGTAVMHKPGTSGTEHGLTAATNDIGLIALPDGRRLAIAVFVTDSTAPDAARDAVIARIARAAYDAALAPSACGGALRLLAVCKSANALALEEMNRRGVEAVTVVQEVASGALLVFAASRPAQLDVSTLVRPLSLAKVFLAASWWDRGRPDPRGWHAISLVNASASPSPR